MTRLNATNATARTQRYAIAADWMWLQCDMFFYGAINLAKALTARRPAETQQAQGSIGKRFVNMSGRIQRRARNIRCRLNHPFVPAEADPALGQVLGSRFRGSERSLIRNQAITS